MRDGLFKRYITTFSVTLLSCTVMLGITFLYFSARNFTGARQQTLQAASDRALEAVRGNYKQSIDGTLETSAEIYDSFVQIREGTGVTVFFTDRDGNVVVCSEGDACVHTTPIGDRALKIAVSSGSYSAAGYLEGFFRQRGNYVYGVPLLEREGDVVGFVFVSTPITPLISHLTDMSLTFLVSAGIMLLLAAAIIYIATRRLTAPLSEISNAARSFGSGNFSARVTVPGSDEIANLAKSFNSMADSLMQYESQRRSFVANVSHELRTPMTTIGGYIDGILDHTIPRDKEDYYLGIVSDEIKRLSRLSTSLLNMSRLEEGAYKIEPICGNVWGVIVSVMTSLERRITDKKIHIPDLDGKPHFALHDPDVLHQVLYNLLDNAIKFTPAGGVISIKVEQQSGHILVLLRNSGKGIAPEELQHIFERFYKADKSRSLDRTGTGLGLYIARTLALKMGASLTVQSEQGSWTQFTLELAACTPNKKLLKETKTQTFKIGKTFLKDTNRKAGGKPEKPSSWFKKLGGTK